MCVRCYSENPSSEHRAHASQFSLCVAHLPLRFYRLLERAAGIVNPSSALTLSMVASVRPVLKLCTQYALSGTRNEHASRTVESIQENVQVKRLHQKWNPRQLLLRRFTATKHVMCVGFLLPESLKQVRSQVVTQSVV
jgi:hypothetical protein